MGMVGGDGKEEEQETMRGKSRRGEERRGSNETRMTRI